MKHLTLIRGLPGSGKTTLAQKLRDSEVCYDTIHLEADQFFTTRGVYRFNPSLIKKAHQWCQNQVRISMAKGWDTIVSNTFTQHWEMKPYKDMAEEFGYTVSIIKVDGPWENIHGVPPEKIEQMRNRWED